MTQMKVGAVYARKSREDKSKNNISIDQQVEDGKKKLEDMGYSVSDEHIYIDSNISGDCPPSIWTKNIKKSRPSLGLLLQHIDNRNIHAIACRALDRLSRERTELALKLYDYINTRDVRVITTHDILPEVSSPNGELQLTILLAFGRYERHKIRERILATKRYAKDNGLKLGGVRLLGYEKSDKGSIVINEAEADIVHNIYNKYLNGFSLVSIAKWLAINHPDKSKGWTYTQVRAKLVNPLYIGKCYHTEGFLIDSKCYPPIINAVTFEKVQRRIESRKNTRSISNTNVHLLAGMLTCKICGDAKRQGGRHLTPQIERSLDGKFFTYTCRHNHANKPFRMKEDEWDRWAIHFFSVARLREDKSNNEESALLKIKRSKLEYSITEAAQAVEKQELSVSAYATLVNKLENSISIIDNIIASQAPVETPEFKNWDVMNVDEKREWLKSVIAKIEVSEFGVTVTLNNNVELPDYEPTFINQLADQIYFPLITVKSKAQRKHALLPLDVNIIWHPYVFDTSVGLWSPDWSFAKNIRYVKAGVSPDQRQCPKCDNFYARSEYGTSGYCKACARLWQRERKFKLASKQMPDGESRGVFIADKLAISKPSQKIAKK